MAMVTVNEANSIATIRLSNPPTSTLNAAMLAELEPILDRIKVDPDVHAVIFIGDEDLGVFVRSYSVEEVIEVATHIAQSTKSDEELMERARRGTAVSRCFDKIAALPQPTIAAINGLCQGGGYELALSCDFRVAQEGDYRIGLPEVRLGLIPGAGGTQRLTRLVGEAKAKEVILLGRTYMPEEALALGLVSIVAKSALEKAREIAIDLTQIPQGALRSAKAVISSGSDLALADGIGEERSQFVLRLREPATRLYMQQYIDGEIPLEAFTPSITDDAR